MNQGYKVREIAYTTQFIGDYKPFTKENLEECLTDMLELSESENNGVVFDNGIEDLHKGVYQDDYFLERNGNEYVIQHDIVCDYLVLYEIIKEEEK